MQGLCHERNDLFMPRPIFCTVSLAAMQHNLSIAKNMAMPRAAWGVIKANAYGHGTDMALQGFAQADGLAMLDFKDAQFCRQAGWTKPILMLEGAFEHADVLLAQRLNLNLVVHSQYQLDWIIHSDGPTIGVHLKINTGMNRLGFQPAQASGVYQQLVDCKRTSQIVWMTHFANADAPAQQKNGVLVERQMACFGHGTNGSVANSAALLSKQQATPQPASQTQNLEHELGWVRPGIALYGSSPFANQTAAALGLEPAMALTATIIAVQHLNAGDQVGYGSSFTAAAAMRIGIVSCGYADGYPRHCASGAPIAVDGVRTRTVGRVSMDMLAVDISQIACAGLGSTVELWGAVVPIDEVATAAGTIGYELMCAITARVTRRSTLDLLGAVNI